MSGISKAAAIVALAFFLLVVIAWAPWMTPDRAESLVVEAFVSGWQGVIDGCGFDCEGCGAQRARRMILGYSVDIEYACGLLPYDSPEFHLTETAYVSPFGTIHGLDTP